MNESRHLCSIDAETTGPDPAVDRIVTLSLVFAEAGRLPINFGFNPGVTMRPEVIAVHGITNEQAAEWPTFKSQATAVLGALAGCDLVGFNLLNFDVPILWEEFNRAGIAWHLGGIRIIDVSNIFRKKEERTLSAGVRFYLGRDHAGAHGAEADARATLDILHAQLHRYPDLPMGRDELAAFSRYDNRIDLAGRIVRNAAGVPVYGFGKAKDVPVLSDRGYGSWMLKNAFSAQTKQVLMDIFAGKIT